MYKATGKLRYSSTLNEDVKWWLVIDCDDEIGRYYRNLFYLMYNRCRMLQRPAWRSHISVVRNEEPSCKDLWGKYNDQMVEFQYNPNPAWDGVYVWLDVECEFLLNIREELGLPRQPQFPLHLTIGNAKFDNDDFPSTL